MISNPESKCRYSNHQQREIIGVCVNQQCNQQKPICFLCIENFHQSHSDDLLKFDEFEAWRQNGITIMNNFKIVLNGLEQAAQLLRELITKLNIDINFNLTGVSFDVINNEVNKAFLTASLNSLLSPELSQLNGLLQSFQDKCKQMRSQNKEKLGQIQPDQLLLPYLIQEQIQVKQEKFEKDMTNFQFKFSTIYKARHINISQQGSVIEYPCGECGFCVCEPAIDSNCITTVAFKIIKCIGGIYIGVCQRDKIKEANYDPDIDKIGHGSYLIDNNGYSFSRHQSEINSKKQLFEFFRNDIILVNVDFRNKKISWTLKQSNETFTMQFNLQSELSYLVGFIGSGSILEIIK